MICNEHSCKILYIQAFVFLFPGTMIGNTDTRHYLRFTNNVYRFSPTIMFPDDLPRFHGDNERISIKNYEQAINFYYHVIQNSNKERFEASHKHGELWFNFNVDLHPVVEGCTVHSMSQWIRIFSNTFITSSPIKLNLIIHDWKA